MKKSLLLFTLCCITLVGWAADAPKYFAVWLNNGQRIDLLLYEKPTTTFTEGILKFEASGIAIEYEASEVKEFTFESTPSSGIRNVSADGKDCTVRQAGNMLNISGADPYAKINLYNSGGMFVSSHFADGTGSLSVSLEMLGQGVYILKIDTTTLKIIKR